MGSSNDASLSPRVIGPTCPCIGHCSTTLGDDVCRGCLRTLDEVTRWPLMSDNERTSVNLRIADLAKQTQHQLSQITGSPPARE